MKPTVLLVEDEIAVREAVQFHLAQAGFVVLAVATTQAAWDALPQAQVVVLDWTLPDEAGVAWLRRVRNNAQHRALPVLMLTARALEVDRVEGLNAGADDYLVKPFGAPELVARVRALLRRAGLAQVQGRLHVGPLTLDVDTHTATLKDKGLVLTRREFDLLAFLALHVGRVYNRNELLDRVWGEDFVGGERTVDQHITQLRAHLGDDAHNPRFLETVRGKGYRLRPQDNA